MSHALFSGGFFRLGFLIRAGLSGLLLGSLNGFNRGRFLLNSLRLLLTTFFSGDNFLSGFLLLLLLLHLSVMLLVLFLVWLFGDTTFIFRLLVGEIRVQKYHAVVHNLQVLSQQAEVAVELAEKRVNVGDVYFNHERFSSLLVLGLDYKVVCNRLVNFDVVEAITEILLTSVKHFLLNGA